MAPSLSVSNRSNASLISCFCSSVSSGRGCTRRFGFALDAKRLMEFCITLVLFVAFVGNCACTSGSRATYWNFVLQTHYTGKIDYTTMTARIAPRLSRTMSRVAMRARAESKAAKAAEKAEALDDTLETTMITSRSMPKKSKDEVTGAFNSQDPHPLWQFFEPTEGSYALPPSVGKDVHFGRAWSADELRRKSWNDLHTLWYVLLKERNILATQREEQTRSGLRLVNVSQWRQRMCQQSMARIKFVLRERQLAFEELQKKQSEEMLKEVSHEDNVVMDNSSISSATVSSIDSASTSSPSYLKNFTDTPIDSPPTTSSRINV